jgi:hypothetical protein
VLVALITGVFGLLSIKMQRNTHREVKTTLREVKNPNGHTTGESVEAILAAQQRCEARIEEHIHKTAPLEEWVMRVLVDKIRDTTEA